VTLGVVVAAWYGASLLTAQTPADVKGTQVWKLQGLRAGYCVRFLMEPRRAAKELRDGFLLLGANRDTHLHPALRNVIKAQPEFASWSPSSLCLYYLDAVEIAGQRVADKKGRRAQMIGVWTLATSEQGSGTRRDLVLDMFSGRGPLKRAAELDRVRLNEARSGVLDMPDTTSDEYSLKIGKTTLVWVGRPAGDSTRAALPIQESWSAPSMRQGLWNVGLTLKPAWSRSLVGSLRVEGKGDLGKALKASPIRFVGPFYRGGGGELRFSRAGP
jgi:hypothetical protein